MSTRTAFTLRGRTASRWLEHDEYVDVEADLLLLYRTSANPHEGENENLSLDNLGRYLAIIDWGAEPDFATDDDLGKLTAYLSRWYAQDDEMDLGSVISIKVRDLDSDAPVPYTPAAVASPELQERRRQNFG